MSKRLEKLFDELDSKPIDAQKMYDRSMEAVALLIDNLAARIEWHQATHRRLTRAARARGETPPAPASMAAEIETLGRIIATLSDDKLDSFRETDPDAGAREIVRILQLAREDFGKNVKEDDSTKGGKEAGEDKDAPEGEIDEGDKTRQIPTPEAEARIERPQEPCRRILGHGKVRRGSG